jgi:hypothetical protein
VSGAVFANATDTATATAALTRPIDLAAGATGASTATSDITIVKPLNASATDTATATADITAQIKFAANATASATATADITTSSSTTYPVTTLLASRGAGSDVQCIANNGTAFGFDFDAGPGNNITCSWDLAGNRTDITAISFNTYLTTMCCSADGTILYGIDWDNNVWRLSGSGFTTQTAFATPIYGIQSLQCTADGSILVASKYGADYTEVAVWNASNPSTYTTLTNPFTTNFDAGIRAYVSDDGSVVADDGSNYSGGQYAIWWTGGGSTSHYIARSAPVWVFNCTSAKVLAFETSAGFYEIDVTTGATTSWGSLPGSFSPEGFCKTPGSSDCNVVIGIGADDSSGYATVAYYNHSANTLGNISGPSASPPPTGGVWADMRAGAISRNGLFIGFTGLDANTSNVWPFVTQVSAPGGTAAALAGDATTVAAASADLTTGINLNASATDTSTATAALTRAIAFTASASDSSTATGALTATILFAASASDTSSATAALTTQTQLNASATDVSAASALLTRAIDLGGAASGTAAVTGDLTTQILLNASASDVSTLTAAITRTIALSANYADASTSTADITAAIKFAADAGSICNATADLGGGIVIAAAATGVSTSTADITTQILLAAAASDATSVTAALTRPIQLAGDAANVTTASAAITRAIDLVAAASNATTVTGAVTRAIALAASVADTATATAAATRAVQLVAGAADISAANADLTAGRLLAAGATATAMATAAIDTQILFAAAANAVSTASALIDGTAVLSVFPTANVQLLPEAVADLNVSYALNAASACDTGVAGDMEVSRPLNSTVVVDLAASVSLIRSARLFSNASFGVSITPTTSTVRHPLATTATIGLSISGDLFGLQPTVQLATSGSVDTAVAAPACGNKPLDCAAMIDLFTAPPLIGGNGVALVVTHPYIDITLSV